MTPDRGSTDELHEEGFRRGADWLYASGYIGRCDWTYLRLALPLEVLADRYVRKEITQEEYIRIRDDLTGDTGRQE